MIEWLLVPIAYLLGSISSAIIVCRVMNLPDPRGEGSGNPGATNVMRFGGKKAAAITLGGDLLKGLIPVVIAQALDVSALSLSLIGLAAFLGHLYPIFFEFNGGKGVATAFGVFSGFSGLLGLAVLATWFAVYKSFKISSLSALTAAIIAPVYVWFIMGEPEIIIVAVLMSVLLLYRHKTNIERLFAGTET